MRRHPATDRMGRSFFLLCSMLVCMLAIGSEVRADDLDGLLQKITASYAESGFSADFVQVSTLDVMDLVDTANGRLLVKKPDKMRWEYHHPEPQTIVTDGQTLWVHRPLDRQVMIGRAPVFFGDGKGAGFLSDVSRLKDQFTITIAQEQTSGEYRLLLEPHEAHPEMDRILMTVDASSYRITAVETRNQFGDTTRITFQDLQPEPELDDSLFHFDIPEGVDIIQLDEP